MNTLTKNRLRQSLISVTALAAMPLAWAADMYDTTARIDPQIIAAGVSPSKIDLTDDHFDIIALVRPGESPIRSVSFKSTDGFLRMAMTRSGVLSNGDELYRLTFTFGRGSIQGTIPTVWGADPGEYNIIATGESQNQNHTYPYLRVGNFPALPEAVTTTTTQPPAPINYDTTARYAPQVVMAGYTPTILDFGDDQFDIIAVVRPGNLDIKHVTLKQNQGNMFNQRMEQVGELDNGDQVYKFTFIYDRGSLGDPKQEVMMSYQDLWGADAVQFGIEAIDIAERYSHKFPDLEFGNYPEFVRPENDKTNASSSSSLRPFGFIPN